MKRIGKDIGISLLGRDEVWKQSIVSQNKVLANSLLTSKCYELAKNCLICDGLVNFVLDSCGFSYDRCDSCGHIQSRIRPDNEYLKNLYSSNDEYYSSQDEVYVNLNEVQLELRISEIAKPKVDYIADVIEWSIDDLWIDIGSGTGDVLVSAKKLGFEVVGLDSSKTETNLALARNLDARLLYFDENTEFPLFSDAKIVSLFNIVEHTSNPIVFLLNIAQQMKSNSYIVIEVPRANSFSTILQMTLSDNNYRHIFAPEHLNVFSDKSMELLLVNCGFEPSSTWTFGSDAIEIFDFVTRAATPNIDIDYAFLVEPINKLQINLDNAGLSDVMLIIAKKK